LQEASGEGQFESRLSPGHRLESALGLFTKFHRSLER